MKYLSNFWRSLDIPLINCNVELKLKWTKYCVFSAGASDNNILVITIILKMLFLLSKAQNYMLLL